jgi:hypothetical protein
MIDQLKHAEKRSKVVSLSRPCVSPREGAEIRPQARTDEASNGGRRPRSIGLEMALYYLASPLRGRQRTLADERRRLGYRCLSYCAGRRERLGRDLSNPVRFRSLFIPAIPRPFDATF